MVMCFASYGMILFETTSNLFQPKTPSPSSSSSFLAIISSDIFWFRKMFILFLMTADHAKTLPSIFQLFWTCFGWVQKWHKFELNPNLFYFFTSKKLLGQFIQILQKSRIAEIITSQPTYFPTSLCISFFFLFEGN